MIASRYPSGSLRATDSGFQTPGFQLADIQANRDRPESIILQPHAIEHGFIVGALHKAGQGRKSAGGQHFEIARLALIQGDVRQIKRDFLEQRGAFLICHEIYQLTAMGGSRIVSVHFAALGLMDSFYRPM